MIFDSPEPPRRFWSHPTFCSVITGIFSLGVMRPELEVNHSPSSDAEIKNGLSCICVPPVCLHGGNRDKFTFFSLHISTVLGPGPPRCWGSAITLLWTSDQHNGETSTGQHATLSSDIHPCPRRDCNTRCQQVSGRRDQ